jgi:serpin B
MRRLAVLVVLLSLLAPVRPAAARMVRPVRPDPTALVAGGVNGLGLSLYARERAEKGNLVFSPASIGFALGLVLQGAAGATERELAGALGVDRDADLAADGFAALLAAGRKVPGVQLRIASRLWAQAGLAFAKPFLALARDRFGAPVALADFVKKAEATRVSINKWVGTVTNGRIRELLPAGSVQDASLVIVNAIWFKGSWAHRFDKAATRDLPFAVSATLQPAVPTMSEVAPAGYAQVDGVQALELPYKGGAMSMVVLLPDDAGGLDGLEQRLDAAHLAVWLGALRPRDKVDVQLPRFRAEATLPLGDLLQQLGVRLLFGDDADLSRMLASGERGLKVSGAFHKAFVAVDEEGAEAAAATAVVVTREAVEEPPAFHADRPFVWLIRDQRSGLIYFLGRVVDPR